MYSNEKSSSGSCLLLFLIGAFSLTQIRIFGKIGISELIMLIFSPYLYLRHITILKRDGITTILYLALLWLLGAIVSDICNNIPFYVSVKGLAVPCVMFSGVLTLYLLLKRDPMSIKWFLLGVALSAVISIYVFQRGGAGDVAITEGREAGAELVVKYKLFWVDMISRWVQIPIAGWYMQVPVWLTGIIVLALAVFDLRSGGRSAFLTMIVTFFIIVIGRKKKYSQMIFKRFFFAILIGGGILGIMVRQIYNYAATSGYMGDQELEKFEHQAQGVGTINLLMAGRSEFFIGLYAASTKPILGRGTHAIDYEGMQRRFLIKYGNDSYATKYMIDFLGRHLTTIPAHSHIICYWLWHGIFALFFWLYVFWLILTTFKNRLGVYPPLFGYLAISLPAFLWDFFFSPLGIRVSECALIAICMLLKNMERKQRLMGESL